MLKRLPVVSDFAIEELSWIKVQPKVIYFVDYSKGIGRQGIINL